ncbi:hypothetical protein [uncultured Sphingomonas sp.]|uniref:hypothetical protein n=1 Tax=uncultured Sphingomonas sp. TaxID=158754 RepID=UPI0025F2BCEF|nr:hypothetical protein [uncultured Sphingomonas sp.]
MKTPNSRSKLVQARNALRPFFRNPRQPSRWKQFQTIRQTASASELPELMQLMEQNPAYGFPGLGNTYPTNSETIPDTALIRLSPLHLNREIKIQIARINHHAEKLTDALLSMSELNELLLKRSSDDFNLASEVHKGRFGLSVALMRKELLASLQHGGLSGLSRRYKSLISGCERRAWGLIAHTFYDVLDPAYNPERANHHWLQVTASRGDRGQWYSAIIRSELLSGWDSRDELAVALLRYSGSSLIDLALCVWKAHCVHPDWSEVEQAWKTIDSRIRNVLESQYTWQHVDVSPHYYLESDDPEDIEVYRASFFFQESRAVLTWRSNIRQMLYSTQSQNALTFLLSAKAIEPTDSDEGEELIISTNVNPIRQFVDEIVPADKSVDSYGFMTSVFVAALLRGTTEDQSPDANQIIRLLSSTHNIENYLDKETLLRLSSVPSLMENGLCMFLMADLIFRRERSQDNELDRRAAFMQLFPLGGYAEIVPYLVEVARTHPKTARRLATLCTRTFLEKLYLLVSSVKEVLEARIAICSWLLDTSKRASQTIREERDALARELANLDARSDLDSTRVHVDEESLREWYIDTQQSRDVRYQQTVLAEGPLGGHGTFLESYNKTKERGQEEDSEDFSSDTRIGAEFILLELFESTLRAFVSDKSFGLDAYLSRRIRHGTLRGFIATPISRIRTRIADEINNEERASERAALVEVLSVFDQWREFFDERLDDLRREVIQIKSPKHPDGLIEASWKTPTNVRHLDAMLSRSRHGVINTRGRHDLFTDVYSLCWDVLERDLAQLRMHLARDFLREMLNALSQKYLSFDIDQRAVAGVFWKDAHLTLQARVQEVCGWFIRPVFRRDTYDLQTLVDSTISIVRELDDTYEFAEEVEVDRSILINRGGFDVIGDILFVLIGNAAKHGKRGGKVQISAKPASISGEVVVLEVVSEVGTLAELQNAGLNVKKAADERDLSVIESAGVVEGFSGIRKVIGLLNRVRSNDTYYSVEVDAESLSLIWKIITPSIITFARERT